MNKSFKIAFGGILLLVLILTYLQATEPEPVNWNPSYLETDKIALGSFVFYESWKESPSAKIEKVSLPPFEFLNEENTGTYFFLNDVLSFDDAELKKLLNWVSDGNTLFLSANSFSQNLLDTLKVETAIKLPGTDFSSQPFINLVHPKLKQVVPFQYEHEATLIYFSKIDTLNNTVLGISALKSFKKTEGTNVNFIKADFGKGSIFMHTMPEAFSNYFLLSNSNYTYAEAVLGYIGTAKTVYWDRYYKTGKAFYTSPLYILLHNRTLKWAYYFALLGSVLFIIFEGKRKQRAIPVVEPLRNQTYEYSGTIADLYLEQKQYKALALKKIYHFYDYIRTRYRIDTSLQNEAFYNEIAAKCDRSIPETDALFKKINEFSNKPEITKIELQQLNDVIQSFKQPE
ncbi:MAG TPA: DUF4350 domain-containing protein [Gillisia sp.]|nr:DUF4350 domain-containing protein [Gillisia sp.]